MKTSVKFFLLLAVVMVAGVLQFFESVLFDPHILDIYNDTLPYFDSDIFQIIWAVGYIYAGILFWLVLITKKEPFCKYAMLSFGITFLLTIFWTYFFFAKSNSLVAGVLLLLALTSSFFTFYSFTRVRANAGLLFVVYIIWLIVISYMNLIAILIEHNIAII